LEKQNKEIISIQLGGEKKNSSDHSHVGRKVSSPPEKISQNSLPDLTAHIFLHTSVIPVHFPSAPFYREDVRKKNIKSPEDVRAEPDG
jgi:hypothetical protein